MLIAIISFLIVIAVCVIVHEYGHYITAKILGVQVHEFAFGMGPAVFQIEKNNMLWSLRLFPVGGFCRLAGMDEEEEGEQVISGMGFNEQPAWKRFLILFNGPLFNILLAVILMAMFLFMHGVQDMEHSKIGEIMPGFPAENSGLKVNDEILSVNGIKAVKWRDTSENIRTEALKDQKLNFEILRDGKILNFKINVPINSEYHRPMLGISPAYAKYNFIDSFKNSIYYMYRMTVLMLRGLADWILQRQEIEVTGPVGIASMSGRAMSSGLWSFVTFVAIISLNLGLMNLFPIPALDGGRILFVILEFIFRRRVPEKIENWIHVAGFVLVVSLMVIITCKDVYNIFMTH